MSDECKCNPARPLGCESTGCPNHGKHITRRERIATAVLGGLAAHPQGANKFAGESEAKANARLALEYADALIEEIGHA